MYKQCFSVLATLVAASAFAMTPGVAMAQHHGGGHGGGGHATFHGGGGHATFHGGGGHASFHGGGGHATFHGGGFHGGVGHVSGFHGGAFVHNGFHHGGFVHDGFRHDGFRHGGWGWGFPLYGGWGLGYPWYSGYSYAPSYYDYGYAPSYYGDSGYYDTYPYDYGGPSYYDYNAVPAYGDTTPPALGYDAQAAPAPDNVAYIDVIVPPDAKVWFGGMLTQQTGSDRQFSSPPLTPGQDYTYDITARWTANGQEVTRTRRIDVRANSSTTVDFTRPALGQ